MQVGEMLVQSVHTLIQLIDLSFSLLVFIYYAVFTWCTLN